MDLLAALIGSFASAFSFSRNYLIRRTFLYLLNKETPLVEMDQIFFFDSINNFFSAMYQISVNMETACKNVVKKEISEK